MNSARPKVTPSTMEGAVVLKMRLAFGDPEGDTQHVYGIERRKWLSTVLGLIQCGSLPEAFSKYRKN